jgi:hypothetical protein
LRITRFPSLSEQQYLGCTSAFVDSLSGELNSATLSLRRLEGRGKGSAFAYEMALDSHRYGALIVLDRWSSLAQAFGAHLQSPIAAQAPERVSAAETLLARANGVLDAAEAYTREVVEACVLAFQSAQGVFDEERRQSEQSAALGPMLPEDYREARRIFLEDLAAR